MSEGGDADLRKLFARRAELPDLLGGQPRSKRDLFDRLDVSSSTIDRTGKRLKDHGFVERTSGE